MRGDICGVDRGQYAYSFGFDSFKYKISKKIDQQNESILSLGSYNQEHIFCSDLKAKYISVLRRLKL